MPSLTPYIGTSVARLTAMINQDNNNHIAPGVDFTFGVPAAFDGDDGRNTKVTLTPVAGTPYAGPQDIEYWRLGIDAIGRLPEGSVDPVSVPAGAFTIHGILTTINTALGLNLTTDEVEEAAYTGGEDTYTLTVLDTSLCWFGSTYDFAAYIGDADIPLDEVITITSLSGFDYVQPPT